MYVEMVGVEPTSKLIPEQRLQAYPGRIKDDHPMAWRQDEDLCLSFLISAIGRKRKAVWSCYASIESQTLFN